MAPLGMSTKAVGRVDHGTIRGNEDIVTDHDAMSFRNALLPSSPTIIFPIKTAALCLRIEHQDRCRAIYPIPLWLVAPAKSSGHPYLPGPQAER